MLLARLPDDEKIAEGVQRVPHAEHNGGMIVGDDDTDAARKLRAVGA